MRAQAFTSQASPAPVDTTAIVVAGDLGATRAGQISIQLIESAADIPLSATAWNALVSLNETNSVFQTHEWFDACYREAGRASLFEAPKKMAWRAPGAKWTSPLAMSRSRIDSQTCPASM
jgi:hypothetical protein